MALRNTRSDGWVMVQSSTVGSKRPPLGKFETLIWTSTKTTFVTLFSNASTEIYTLNSQTSLTNRLALPVALGSSSDWEVGLAEITYKPPQRTIVQGAIIDVVSDLNVLIYCNLVTPHIASFEDYLSFTNGKTHFSNIYYLPVEFKTFWSIHINMTILTKLNLSCISVLMKIIQQHPRK